MSFVLLSTRLIVTLQKILTNYLPYEKNHSLFGVIPHLFGGMGRQRGEKS
jgi:hypothetical protein